jgi:hypothetical protein
LHTEKKLQKKKKKKKNSIGVDVMKLMMLSLLSDLKRSPIKTFYFRSRRVLLYSTEIAFFNKSHPLSFFF